MTLSPNRSPISVKIVKIAVITIDDEPIFQWILESAQIHQIDDIIFLLFFILSVINIEIRCNES